MLHVRCCTFVLLLEFHREFICKFFRAEIPQPKRLDKFSLECRGGGIFRHMSRHLLGHIFRNATKCQKVLRKWKTSQHRLFSAMVTLCQLRFGLSGPRGREALGTLFGIIRKAQNDKCSRQERYGWKSLRFSDALVNKETLRFQGANVQPLALRFCEFPGENHAVSVEFPFRFGQCWCCFAHLPEVKTFRLSLSCMTFKVD